MIKTETEENVKHLIEGYATSLRTITLMDVTNSTTVRSRTFIKGKTYYFSGYRFLGRGYIIVGEIGISETVFDFQFKVEEYTYTENIEERR